MVSDKPTSAELFTMQERMAAFRDKFEELASLCTPFSSQWIASHLVPLDGKEDEVGHLKAEVAYLSGLAEPGIVQANSYISGTLDNGQSIRLSPTAAWLTVMQPKPLMNADDVITACRGAEGRLQTQAEAQRRVENSMAWRLARVIGWPRSVRELAGFTAGSRAGKATVWSISAVMFALVTGILGSFGYAVISGLANLPS